MYRALAFADSVPGEVARGHDPDKIDAGIRLLEPNDQGQGALDA